MVHRQNRRRALRRHKPRHVRKKSQPSLVPSIAPPVRQLRRLHQLEHHATQPALGERAAVFGVQAAGFDELDAALAHIERHSSSHTDAIVTDDPQATERFLSEVDSAIVMRNASTQFADGAEFGMGAEIGIATGRLHARGPVGAEQLTIFKYVVRGTGQIRP